MAGARRDRVVIVGAGIGGLAAAVPLAARGLDVTVVERAETSGGKIRQLAVPGPDGAVRHVDAGPTVFTLRDVFDQLFEDAGSRLEDHVRVAPASLLARHVWPDGSLLDLHADPAASTEAIAAFAGPAEARAFAGFMAEAARIHRTLDRAFMRRQRTTPWGLSWRLGLDRLSDLVALRPYTPLVRALAGRFRDPRLVQLFGRYATYAGSSPYRAPATLMLIAHVEAEGVWLVEGGIPALARGVEALARRHGVRFRLGTEVAEIRVSGRVSGVRLGCGEVLEADHVIFNGDPAALAEGLLGPDAIRAAPKVPRRARSLSAVTLALVARVRGFPLAHHNVVFSADYAREFAEIAAGRLPADPTVYVCAEDRGPFGRPEGDAGSDGQPERLLAIVNARADGDLGRPAEEEVSACIQTTMAALAARGLTLDCPPTQMAVTTPADFARRFPATGGAIYGRASHGWLASFLRPGSRTRIPGLYCAGGGVHPGAGVPMAALSGRLAAEALLEDRASMSRFRRVAMAGGMSTPSRPTAASASPSSPLSAASSPPTTTGRAEAIPRTMSRSTSPSTESAPAGR